MYKSILISLLTGLCAGILHAEEPAESRSWPSLMELVPEDVYFVSGVMDVQKIAEDYENSFLSELIEVANLKEVFAPAIASFMEEMEADEDGAIFTYVDWEELREYFPKTVLVGIFQTAEMDENYEPEAFFFAHYAGTEEDFVRMLRDGEMSFYNPPESDGEEKEPEYIYTEERIEGALTLIGEPVEGVAEAGEEAVYYILYRGIYLELYSRERFDYMLNVLLEDEGDPLLLQETVARFWGSVAEEPDAFFYLHLDTLMPDIERYVRDEVEEIEVNPLGVTKDKLLDALDLPVFNGLYGGFRFEGEKLFSDTILLRDAPRGIASLLVFGDEPLSPVDVMPENAISALVSRFDFSGMADGLLGMMVEVSPAFSGMYEMYMAQLKNTTGIDFRSSLIENFEPEMVSCSYPLAAPLVGADGQMSVLMNEFFLFKLKDSTAMENAVRALLDQFLPGTDLMTEKTFLGETVFSFGDPTGNEFSYAFVDGYLVLANGEGNVMQGVIQRMKEGTEYSIWELPGVEYYRDLFPDDPVQMQYTSVDETIGMLTSLLAQLEPFLGAAASEDGEQMIQFEAIPEDISFPYSGFSQSYVEDSMIYTKSVIFPTDAR